MSTTSDNHIMFSYSWKSGHEKVHDIARQFQAADIPIWMDIYNGLGPNLLDGMAEAVEGSAAVCCFITPEYQESRCCKMELTYAHELNKTIIPCFLTKFQPKRWLGFITAGLIYYDFSNGFYGTVLNQLMHYVKRDILKVIPTIPPRPHPISVTLGNQYHQLRSDTTQKCAVGRMDSPEEQSSLYNGFLPDIFPTQTGYRASQNLQNEYSTLHGDWSIQPLSVCTDHRNSNISKTRTGQGTSRNDETQLPLNYKDYLWCNYLDN
ncbi:unnamed protein product [Rotaria sordida]|uniref:TIR domain-containing protein n=1 Tax=Rotaria sordida TaxID=392033 RepID=A0A814YK66_9BILA|nr:unnamed protein product [Rotaria sordida]CAF1513380.1 unnamed protein product [Rotaria sordida]